jgi:hypothetical protein
MKHGDEDAEASEIDRSPAETKLKLFRHDSDIWKMHKAKVVKKNSMTKPKTPNKRKKLVSEFFKEVFSCCIRNPFKKPVKEKSGIMRLQNPFLETKLTLLKRKNFELEFLQAKPTNDSRKTLVIEPFYLLFYLKPEPKREKVTVSSRGMQSLDPVSEVEKLPRANEKKNTTSLKEKDSLVWDPDSLTFLSIMSTMFEVVLWSSQPRHVGSA